MEFYVDGGCRGNGQPGVIGAAAVRILCVFFLIVAAFASCVLHP